MDRKGRSQRACRTDDPRLMVATGRPRRRAGGGIKITKYNVTTTCYSDFSHVWIDRGCISQINSDLDAMVCWSSSISPSANPVSNPLPAAGRCEIHPAGCCCRHRATGPTASNSLATGAASPGTTLLYIAAMVATTAATTGHGPLTVSHQRAAGLVAKLRSYAPTRFPAAFAGRHRQVMGTCQETN